MADAQAEAARLVAEARTWSQALTQSAAAETRAAEDAENRARSVEHARGFAGQITVAEQHIVDLADEHATLTGRVAALTSRLAELGEQREQVAWNSQRRARPATSKQ